MFVNTSYGHPIHIVLKAAEYAFVKSRGDLDDLALKALAWAEERVAGSPVNAEGRFPTIEEVITVQVLPATISRIGQADGAAEVAAHAGSNAGHRPLDITREILARARALRDAREAATDAAELAAASVDSAPAREALSGSLPQLVKPYGYPRGVGVTFTRRDLGAPLDEGQLAEVLRQYSCWPPAIPKIISAMKASGRYDCRLQQAWFKAQFSQVKADLADLGIELQLQPGEDINRHSRPELEPEAAEGSVARRSPGLAG